MSSLPRAQRVAAYAVILRVSDRSATGSADDWDVLLSRLAPRISRDELWTLPGGGVDHGEDPRDAVLREIVEETGLHAMVSDTARIYSAHVPSAWRDGQRVDAHALRIVYDGWVPVESPEPRVVEVDGSTVEAAWVPVGDVLSGAVPVVSMVTEALADHEPFRMQRLAVYALLRRPSRSPGRAGEEVLLTRLSERAAFPGRWTLPGGGIEHGETPSDALVREVAEETGLLCKPRGMVAVHDTHFSGTAPSGRLEDYHGVHLVFTADLVDDTEPRVVEVDGTTDAVAWVPVDEIVTGRVEVLDVVRRALGEGNE